MTDIATLLGKCRALGAVFILNGDRIKVQASKPLPEEYITELKQSRQAVIEELCYELQAEARCWVLEEWRRISIPSWRKILSQSIQEHDQNREEYARWMLREILEDPEYQEQNHD